MAKKKMSSKEADKKYANGTKYKDPDGKTRTRKSEPKGSPKQRSFFGV